MLTTEDAYLDLGHIQSTRVLGCVVEGSLSLDCGLVAVDQARVQHVIAQQMAARSADTHATADEDVARKIATEAPEQDGLAVEPHAELVPSGG